MSENRKPLTPLSDAERAARLAQMNLGVDLLPLTLTAEERQAAMEPINPGPIVTVSPTGTPVINGTGLVLKLAAAFVGLAAIVLVSDFFPSTNIDEKIAGAIVAIGSMFGIVSPGVRK